MESALSTKLLQIGPEMKPFLCLHHQVNLPNPHPHNINPIRSTLILSYPKIWCSSNALDVQWGKSGSNIERVIANLGIFCCFSYFRPANVSIGPRLDHDNFLSNDLQFTFHRSSYSLTLFPSQISPYNRL
jgi:hypothetical protein